MFCRYKRALHAKKRELEKQKVEKPIENKIENSNNVEEMNLNDGLDALEKVGHGHIQASESNQNNQGKDIRIVIKQLVTIYLKIVALKK